MKANRTFCVTAVSVALLAAACDEGSGELAGGGGRSGSEVPGTSPGSPPGQPPGEPEDPAQCKSREYVGFDDAPLHAARIVARTGVDRGRVKPFTALQAEYQRVLGVAPASLNGAAATFGQVPQRWYEEPQSNAVALLTAHNIAFDGCLGFTATGPEFNAAPDATSAPTHCAAMAKKFWSKTPSPQEIDECVNVAISGTAKEPQARRKWAYACASVLSSAGFLTY